MNGKTDGQAAYEAFRKAFPLEDWGPWERIGHSLNGDEQPGWEAIAAAGAAAAHTRVSDLLGEVNELREERDRARDALAMLARIVHANVLVMEAAAIEMRRGDTHAAMQWILNAMPDQWDGEPGTEWDGRETAQEWFDRQPTVQNEQPGPAVVTAGTEHLAAEIARLAIPDEEATS